ncbi:MAG: pyridoxal phosphate-dependent aminotransferase [bacterium]|nr:pyridoxal phosphate-dependent aminotransferase [bacterium]
MRQPSERSRNIPPFIVMDVLERAQKMERAGRTVIHMEVGEPDFDTPEVIRMAAAEALERGETNYTHSLGLLELREAISEHYDRRYSVRVDPDCILVTSGTSPALFLAFAALLEQGEVVVMNDPHYACYPNFVSFLGGRPLFSPVHAVDGFMPDVREMARQVTSDTAAILINSPGNPTGAVWPGESLGQIAQLGVPVISDEIYHGLVYGTREQSILEFTDEAFVLNGFSKLYAMTGWRLGYVIAPRRFIRPMQKIQQNFFISAAAFVQKAGIAALTQAGGEVAEMVRVYDERRQLLVKGIREIGLPVPVDPQGAFYVLVDARQLGADSYKLAFDILERTGVAVTPGIDFGPGAEGHLRFSYANSSENLTEGLRRLSKYVKEVTCEAIQEPV